MTTSTITGTIKDGSGTALEGVKVVCRLFPRPAFVSATGVEVSPSVETTTNSSGVYTLALERTAGITPSDSYYEITEYISDRYGGPIKHVIQVGSSNQSVLAALVSTPPSPDPNTYLTQAAADARYQQLTGYGVAGDLSTIDPDDSASAGALSTAARSDHQHAIVAATAGASRPNDAAAEGNATSFARSNHTHSRETVYGTAAARAALSGVDLYAGLWFRETDTGKLYTYRASAWLQVSDLFIVADSSARTGISTLYEGMQVYQLDTNTLYTYDGTSWWTTGIAAASVTAFTSTISQGASTNIAKTTNYSQYRIVDGICEWWFNYAMTAAGTAGSQVTLTLPVTSGLTTVGTTLGNGMIYDSSVPTIDTGQWEIVTSTTISLAVGESTSAPWGTSPNLALASGDLIRGHVRFPVSSAA